MPGPKRLSCFRHGGIDGFSTGKFTGDDWTALIGQSCIVACRRWENGIPADRAVLLQKLQLYVSSDVFLRHFILVQVRSSIVNHENQ
jgi:hypothetical protein